MATQAERRAETRSKLIAAGTELFGRDGYHAASVEQIASHAGYSTGAVYGHFGGKEDLFLAIVEHHITRQLDHYQRAVSTGATVQERARKGADEWMSYLGREPDYFPLFVAFWSFAISRPDAREKLGARFSELRGMVAQLIDEGAEDLGVPMYEGMSEQLATVVTALGNGLAMEKLIAPDAVPDDLFGNVMTLFFAALAALSREIEASGTGVQTPEPGAQEQVTRVRTPKGGDADGS